MVSNTRCVADGETTLRRLVVTGVMIAALTAGATAAGATVVPRLAPPTSTSKPQPPVLVGEPSTIPSSTPTASASPSASASPTPTPTPTAISRRSADAFATWAHSLTQPLDVPQNVLEAYAYAEYVITQTRPACKLQWTTIAAIGKLASDHGRFDGRVMDPQGWPRPILIGPPLDGLQGRSKVVDTDGGALDGDQTWDRAIGPMQLIPVTWRASGVDADGDELANPQDIDDAALAAAYQLCSSGKDLSVVEHWKAAINGYPGMAPQIDKVFQAAQSYGVLSKDKRYPELRR